MREHLYQFVNRVPKISDEEIQAMRHIEPVLKSNGFYRRIKGIADVHPRNESCIWDAKPIGGEFTFGVLDNTEIITQHKSSMFFKPSLAEVYSWIRVFVPEWERIKFFHLGEVGRISQSTDCWCRCTLLGGATLVRGEELSGGSYQLVEAGE